MTDAIKAAVEALESARDSIQPLVDRSPFRRWADPYRPVKIASAIDRVIVLLTEHQRQQEEIAGALSAMQEVAQPASDGEMVEAAAKALYEKFPLSGFWSWRDPRLEAEWPNLVADCRNNASIVLSTIRPQIEEAARREEREAIATLIETTRFFETESGDVHNISSVTRSAIAIAVRPRSKQTLSPSVPDRLPRGTPVQVTTGRISYPGRIAGYTDKLDSDQWSYSVQNEYGQLFFQSPPQVAAAQPHGRAARE